MEGDHAIAAAAPAEVTNPFVPKYFARTSDEVTQLPEIAAATEKKSASANNFNIRKSIAWDNAFFTCEGVLDNEELAIFSSTTRRVEPCTLPSIHEGIAVYAESCSSFDDEYRNLENLEMGLFENSITPIPASVGDNTKASTTPRNPVPPCLGTFNDGELSCGDKQGKSCRDSNEMTDQPFHAPMPMHSPKRQSMTNKHNIRKSIAWDAAFFTGEGVLNDEELALVSGASGGGGDMGGARRAVAVQGDMRKSAESCSTLCSDYSQLENLEVDLFENLNVSTQRSTAKRTGAPAAATPTRNLAKPQGSSTRISESFKAEICPKDKIPKPTASRRNAPNKQLSVPSSKSPLAPLQVAGGTTLRDSSLWPKPPRMATGKAPNGAAAGEKNTSRSSQTRRFQKSPTGSVGRAPPPASRSPRLPAVRSPQASLSLPSTLRTSSTTLGSSLHSSFDSTTPPAPATAATTTLTKKTPPLKTTTLRRKTNISGVAIAPAAPSRTTQRSSRSSALRSSSAASPRSSMDSLASAGAGQAKDGDIRTSSSAKSAAAPSTMPSAAAAAAAKGVRPSGLRLPTPKIGYFDKEKKSMASNSTGRSNQGAAAAAAGSDRAAAGPSRLPKAAGKLSSRLWGSEKNATAGAAAAAKKEGNAVSPAAGCPALSGEVRRR